MEENPYNAPVEVPASESKKFLHWPDTIIEWVVIVIVVVAAVALLLPNVDEGTEESRKGIGEQQQKAR